VGLKMAAENGAVEMEKTADVQAPPAYSPPTVVSLDKPYYKQNPQETNRSKSHV